MCKRTKGQLQADISKLMVAFEKEYMRRGPTDVKAYLLREMVRVRLKGVLTPPNISSSRPREWSC